MSTSSPPAGPSMRQQLDELDALLQRMLSLPVNQPDDDSAARPPVAPRPAADPSATPPPGRGPRLVLLDGSAPVPPPQSAPAGWDATWNINLNPQQGSSILGPRSPAAPRQQPESAPPVWRAETVAFAPARPEPTPQPPLSAPTPHANPAVRVDPAPVNRPQAAEPAPLPLWPLVAVNRVFDAVMPWLGPPGQWLCTRAGRNLLGYAGLGMILGGAAWAAGGWFGWPR
ncbi:MAG TPA: hypothetical protein VGF55_06740 [Gemmataceae bacterium]|jgi:hypothetical protein